MGTYIMSSDRGGHGRRGYILEPVSRGFGSPTEQLPPPPQLAVAALARIVRACCLVDSISLISPDPPPPPLALACRGKGWAVALSKAHVAAEASKPDSRVSPVEGGGGGGNGGVDGLIR